MAKKPESKTETKTNLLEDVLTRGRFINGSEENRKVAVATVQEYVNQLLDEGMEVSSNVSSMISEQIKKIDELLTDQLNEIMHHEEFQKLEAAWRGLHHFVMNTETSTTLKIRVLNATKTEVQKDLEKAVEFDQSHLFKMIYEEEYGTFGGTPYGMLIGDFEYGRHPQDIAQLSLLSNIAAASHAPFIAGVSPSLLDMDDFTQLPNPRDLAKIFESSEMIKWRSFRESEDSRYVGLAMPHILLRLPYGPDTKPVEEFNFAEHVDGKQHKEYLWGNAAYALGLRVTNAFAKYSWCAAIRGVEGGGLVENLPIHTYTTDDGDIVAKIPTEVAITDRREKELNDLGLIPLCYEKNTDRSAFFGAHTANKPKEYYSDDATANAYLSAQLQYIFAASRFAHYIKAMVRDKIGSFASTEEISNYLNSWIVNYVVLNQVTDFEIKARKPLNQARVDVTADPARPGRYKAVVYLKPHFQLDELTTSIRLVANLPPPLAEAA